MGESGGAVVSEGRRDIGPEAWADKFPECGKGFFVAQTPDRSENTRYSTGLDVAQAARAPSAFQQKVSHSPECA